jgi:hypothetical protein
MSEWVTDGDTIRFVPGAGWDWFGWDGRLKVAAPDRGLSAEGRPVALASDILQLFAQLMGRTYKAQGFDDIPGTGTAAQISVTESTLDRATTIGGQKIVVAKTEGKFVLPCVPSMRAGVPPIPDPVPVKQGRWVVDRVQQSAATGE